MIRYITYFFMAIIFATLFSSCGVMQGKKNKVALENYSIGTSEEVMKQQLAEPSFGGGCEVVATIEIDGGNELKACRYITAIPSSTNVYFYKGKYVGHGNNLVFPKNFIKKIEQEINPLFAATVKGNFDDVKKLLEEGNSPNKYSSDGTSALIVATADQNKKLVELLLNNGADPNMTNNDDASPLMFAAARTNIEILKNLLNHGANIDHNPEKLYSPLVAAVIYNKIDMVKELVSKGANLNIKTQDGTTPLLEAAFRKHYEIAEFLVRSGADRDIPCCKGITLRQIAIDTSDNKLLEIARFNTENITLDKIESHYDDELKKYQQRKEEFFQSKNDYKDKELKFLNALSNEQLETYSIYTDNINNNSTNIAKVAVDPAGRTISLCS